jgi:hypothetical protein
VPNDTFEPFGSQQPLQMPNPPNISLDVNAHDDDVDLDQDSLDMFEGGQ